MAAPEGEPVPVPELEPVPVTVPKPVPDPVPAPVPVPAPAPVQSDHGATEAASSQRRRRGADAAWRSLNAAARGVAAAVRGFGRIEALVAGLALVLMAVLPLADMVTRWRGHDGVPGARPLVQHLMLWVAMLGAGLAAREGRLLALATPQLIRSPLLRRTSNIVAGTLLAGVCALLFRSSLELVVIERQAGTPLALGLPVWVAQAVMPAGFLLIGLRAVRRADDRPAGRLPAVFALLAGLWLAGGPAVAAQVPTLPAVLVLVAAALLGLPIFAALAGVAAVLFLAEGIPLAALPAESYRLAVSPTLAAIPLFTLAGFVLAEGNAAGRLLRVFHALFGWMPGGSAVVVVLIFAFFTVLTGGSGVTILALGGLALQALRGDGYHDRFSVGILTSSASLGLLLPPALPLILYGIIAQVSIEDLFIGGIVPGLLLIGMTVAWGVRQGVVQRIPRHAFRPGEAVRAIAAAKWDLFLPVFILVAIFGGFATLVEAAALTAAYAFVMQAFIHRDLSITRDMPRVLGRATVVLGGVLIILAAAMGLTSYLVDARVPMLAVEWVQERVHSTLLFLLLLNLLLLAVGCMMDIFSATVVIAPLLVPLGLAYGIDPVHLGIIFVANLELGYLTPPVGMNLFLAAYRFERPIGEVMRSVLPLLAIFAAGVLLITYVPALTLGTLELFGRR
jgi:C4-dicarboxylate transporter, DctM subunit